MARSPRPRGTAPGAPPLDAPSAADRVDAGAAARRLEEIVNNSPAVAFEWSATAGWPVRFVSDSVRKFGYEPEQFYAGTLNYAELIHPDDIGRIEDEVAAHMAARVTEYTQHYRVVTASGEVRWVDDLTRVTYDADGRAISIQGIIFDVSERDAAEERARRYLRAAGNLFVALDRDGRVTAVNDRTCRLTGEREARLLGCDWITRFVPEGSRQQSRAFFDELIRSDPPVDEGEFENELLLPDGRRLTIHWNYTADIDLSGETRGLICFGSDVTELGRALTRARDFARFTLENPNPVLRIDRHGDVLLTNPPAEQLIEQVAAYDAESHARWRAMIDSARALEARRTLLLHVCERSYHFDALPIPDTETINLYGREVTLEHEQRRRLEDIANDNPGAIYQYVQRADGSSAIRQASARMFEFFGLEPPAMPTADETDPLTRHRLTELDGAPFWARVHPDDIDELGDSVRRSAETLEQWDSVFRIVPRPGVERWVRGLGTPHRHDDDVLWNSVLVDITEQRLAAERLGAALKGTVGVLAAALEARDPYTAGHQRGVAEIAVRIGQRLGLNRKRLEGLELAATIFDVGKIQIPAEILSRPAPLSDAEFELVRMHAEMGAALVDGVAFEWPIAEMIRQHHERYDGSGYPAGLAGDAILLEAYIIGVADTLQAMLNHRPYRAALGRDAALAEIRSGTGTRYHPGVAAACLALADAGEIAT